MKVIHKISFVFLVGILSCKSDEKKKGDASSQPGLGLASVELTDLQNRKFDLQQYSGKTVFINFWATWCKPCIEEMPSIQKAQQILKDENVVFLMASGESVEQVEQFRDTHDYQFNYVRIENSEALGIQVLPTTFIFSPGGNLVFSEMGFRKWDEKNNIDLIQNTASKK